MPDYLLPTPTASPFDDIDQYSAVLLTAVDWFLDQKGVFPEVDEELALGYMEDLKAWLSLYFPPEASGAVAMSQKVTFWHDESVVTSGNALDISTNSLAIYNVLVRQAPSAIGDTFQQAFSCAAGTYTLHVLGRTGSARGIAQWSIDGSPIGVTDWYSSSAAYNTVLTITGIVLTEGAHTIQATVTGTNGSDYDLRLQKFWLEKTA